MEPMTISPSVRAVIEPIITRMTTVVEIEKNARGQIGNPQNDPYKEDKLACVHYIIKGGTIETQLERKPDGKLRCKACGREMYTQFDQSAVDILLSSRTVIEMIMYFGMQCGLSGDCIGALIDMKRAIPKVAQLCENLSTYVKREESSNSSGVTSIGKEYCFNGITSTY